MTPEKQRIAIAEACGWKKSETNGAPVWWKDGQYAYQFDLPDYLNDLNAMHEAENTLLGSCWSLYLRNLASVCNCLRVEEAGIRWVESDVALVANATSAQRAEAFLRTIGKWE